MLINLLRAQRHFPAARTNGACYEQGRKEGREKREEGKEGKTWKRRGVSRARISIKQPVNAISSPSELLSIARPFFSPSFPPPRKVIGNPATEGTNEN